MTTKTTNVASPEGRRRAFVLLRQYLLPNKGLVALLFLLALLTAGLNIYLPQLIAEYIDAISGGKAFDISNLIALALSYIGISLFMQLSLSTSAYLAALIGWRTTNQLRADLMRHMLSLDMSEHKNRTPGEMIERIDGDVTALSDFFSKFLVLVLTSVLMVIGALLMYLNINVWLGLLVIAFVYFTATAMLSTAKLGEEPSRLERESSAEMFGYIEERLTGLDDIRAMGAGEYHQTRFLGVLKRYFHRAMDAWKARAQIWRVSMLYFAFGYVGILGLGVWLFSIDLVTVGTLFLMFQYLRMIEFPLDQIAGQLQDFQKAIAGVVRINELLNLSTDIQQGEKDLPSTPLSIQFEQVSFSYDKREAGMRVLSDIDFTLPAGETMGLLGRTGSGKTTLTRLVAKLYEPTAGIVKLGGLATTDITDASLRHHIAVVSQDVQLFQASVKDNLTFFDTTFSDDVVREMIELVGLGEWLAQQPDGIHTNLPVGSLSAGQAQLISFARVLLRDPQIVILDEPSSRLDPATESTLTRAMQVLLKNRTAIIIAHRLETVANADRIMVIGSGRILEYDMRQTLLDNSNSHYNRLLQSGKSVIDEALD